MKHYTLFTLAALLGLTASASAQPNVTSPVSMYSYEQRMGTQIPCDLTFRDETGREVRLGDYFGKRPIILAIVQYRCRMLCTEVLNGLVETLRAMPGEPGDAFEVLTISFDPREKCDLAAEKKSSYLEQYGRPHAAKGWHFLTGNEDAIAGLTEAAGFRYEYSPKQDKFAHPTGLVVLTPKGQISAYLDGITFNPSDLEQRLQKAKEEGISPPTPAYHRVLLLCYDYDPSTAGYSLNVMRAVRLGGLVTVVVLGGCILLTCLRSWLAKRCSYLQHPMPLSEQGYPQDANVGGTLG
jgi:protein SCO1/2